MNTKRIILFIVLLVVLAGVAYGGWFYYENLRGVGPAIKPPAGDIGEVIDNSKPKQNDKGKNSDNTQIKPTDELGLNLPKGFNIEILADGIKDVRVVKIGPRGNLWVSQTRQGKISLLTLKDGKVIKTEVIFEGLNNPHGIAFDPQNRFEMYIAEEDKISKVTVYSEAYFEKIIDLPTGGRHTTRTIEFGPDGKLYVSIGSSCDTCIEDDELRAAIYRVNKNGSDFELYAEGLRNAVFFDWHEIDATMWATEMGRDYLGDNLPPDEINVVQEGGHYGWPYCYGKNVVDKKFGKADHCQGYMSSKIDLQAHAAPLGLDFIPEEGWPEDYWYDLIVAYHGSWNRTVPTGYKLMRFKLDAEGSVVGKEDFISGWLKDDKSAYGRPVDVLIQPGGVMYITDDKAGVVYKVSYAGEQSPPTNDKQEPVVEDGCVVTGCSAHICADEEKMTTCEYQEYYSCFKSAVCERQVDGRCDWTLTLELEACLQERAN